MMRRTARIFRLEPLSHGNQKKADRVLWALAGRFENGLVHLKKGDWNERFEDEAGNFPSALVHDDLIDSLSYIDQMAQVPYFSGIDAPDEFECLDAVAGY
jgi:phage terminase large subunit-like protein